MFSIAAVLHRTKRLPQGFLFLVCGGSAALINWLARFPASLVCPFWLAVLIANLVGMAVGFVLYDNFVFPGSTRSLAARVRVFFLVNLGAIVITTGTAVLLLRIGMPRIRMLEPEAIAHAIGIAVGAFANFFGHKRVTYR